MIHLKMFSATWCGPCKSMDPNLEKLASRGVNIVKVDIEKQKAVAAIHGVKGVPTFKVYSDDQLLRTHTGAMSLGQLEEFITP